MAKTTMSILYKGTTYQAEDIYRSSHTVVDYEIISFMKIKDEDFVVLKISNHEKPSMHPMEDFQLLIDLHHLIKVNRPRYALGDCFEHPMSSRKIRVLGVSPDKCSVDHHFTYFVEIIKGNDKPFYNAMSESFLDKCTRNDKS
ncbi:hypothetical protein RE628_17790 [Paenibacillus sp. D2_2]|uniref:hypothetical protein n=1 Tax=Paenibacillus sp. D2_2 TaxID=3073092 RepID=UPI0028169833|nr:hypothetical protein [Paenibacillus sp. D2_2]WMT39305.1 hypothetical protein RE628_17790 [Paenibacillus sp. D2_2]